MKTRKSGDFLAHQKSKRFLSEWSLVFIAAFLMIAVPFASADVDLKEKSVSNVIIKELGQPAVFDITIINNNGYSDIFNIDTLLDMDVTPKDQILVLKNSEKTVTMNFMPSDDMKEDLKGILTFEYYANGEKSNVRKSSLTIDFISLSDLININLPATITKDDTEMEVTINLTRDVELDADLTLVSEFVSYSDEVTLTSKGITLTIPLKTEMPKAGTYEVKATFDIEDYMHSESNNVVLKSEIKINEKDPVVSGWFLNRKIIYEKENTGNSVTDVSITVKKSVVSGLFTSFNIKPDGVTKSGSTATYDFEEELNPGESLTIESTTSYYMPILVILLLIAAGWIFVVVTTPQVKVMKKAVRVRTKSGAFATKIVISARNAGKNEVNDLKIIDRLPAFTEVVPGKFGTISPSEVRGNTLIWNLDRLSPNEEIMLSYIVYSKLTVIGKLDVPLAYVTYKNLQGHLKESKSNGLSVIAPEQPAVQSEIIR